MLDYKSPNVSLDDIVFEGRNHAYGAYMLRKIYNKTVQRSVLIGGAIFVAAFIFMQFVSLQKGEEAVEVVAELANLPPPPPVDPNEPPPPPPPPAPPPPKVATIRFVEMEVAKAEEVVEEVTRVEETENKQIALETQEGEDVAVDLAVPEAGPSLLDEGPKEDEPFVAVEQMPEFPGGQGELFKFISKNVRYPAQARNQNISGKVFVSFVVGSDGTIRDVKTQKGIGYGCDEEAERVIRSMPKWKPGRQSGRNVPVRYSVPISFTLQTQ